MHAAFILLLVTTNFSLFAQSASNKTIHRKNYSIACPETWKADSSGAFGTDVILYSEKEDSLDNFVENVNALSQNLKGYTYTLDKIKEENEANIVNSITDAKITESKIVEHPAEPYYLLKYLGRQGKFELSFIQRYYLKSDVLFVVTATTQKGKEDQFASVFSKILDSFHIIAPN